jgi:hypothetical protein
MLNKIMNWVVFGVLSYVWASVFIWVTKQYGVETNWTYIYVAIFTVALMSGAAGEGNIMQQMVAGMRKFLPYLVGWFIVAVVYNLITSFVFAEGFSSERLVTGITVTGLAAIFTALSTVSLNTCRD